MTMALPFSVKIFVAKLQRNIQSRKRNGKKNYGMSITFCYCVYEDIVSKERIRRTSCPNTS